MKTHTIHRGRKWLTEILNAEWKSKEPWTRDSIHEGRRTKPSLRGDRQRLDSGSPLAEAKRETWPAARRHQLRGLFGSEVGTKSAAKTCPALPEGRLSQVPSTPHEAGVTPITLGQLKLLELQGLQGVSGC